MLHLRKFIKRITHKGMKDIDALRAMLPHYGLPGLMEVAELLQDSEQPETVRIDALMILGTERTQLPTGAPWLMAILEDMAENAPPDIDLVCFVGVYANALRGRPEAAALVDKFKDGTERQRAIFKNTDQQYLKGLAAREHMLRTVAAYNNRLGVK